MGVDNRPPLEEEIQVGEHLQDEGEDKCQQNIVQHYLQQQKCLHM